MSLLKPAVCLLFSITLGWSLSTQANTPPAKSTPDTTPEDPEGSEYFGALVGKASVSAAGNASYIIPIEVPPGTRGMAPAISLNYNSNMRNGLLGLGWFMKAQRLASLVVRRRSHKMANHTPWTSLPTTGFV
ncbi:MAG: SpvB/TcaC N-terminal domain-containing protein [Pseudomonadota bacterium]